MEQIMMGNAIYVSDDDGMFEGIQNLSKEKNIRAEVKPNYQDAIHVLERFGYFPCDLTLRTEIKLSDVDPKIERLCRFTVQREGYSQEIISVAKSIFSYDRRFHLGKIYNRMASEEQIVAYAKAGIKQGAEWLVCKYKGKVGGFIELLKCGEQKHFVYLGGVLPEFRRFGMALSLYYNACCYCRDLGDHSLIGRISATNVSVMNMYAKLGAAFSEPLAIYVRERCEYGAE